VTAAAKALLALEDGTVFEGIAFGAGATVTGEVCFNTSMTGYQEVLTDPSYHEQIVTMTAPQMGNTGTNHFDDQSRRPWVAGFVVRELSPSVSSWRSEDGLDAYMRRHGIPGIAEVDTRKLTRHIRDRGALKGALSTLPAGPDELVAEAREWPGLVGRDIAGAVSTPEAYEWGIEQLTSRASSGYAAGAEGPELPPIPEPRYRIAALDLGVKRNILDLLASSGFEVTVLPARTPATDILGGGFDGVFLSNGPGDPEPVGYAVETVRELLGRLPIFGICLGHQILGLALGGRTFKLPFGHRGGNHPVRRLDGTKIEITCQNHGFAVDPGSLEATGALVTHMNLNDQTCEGLVVPGRAFSVQYHPESGPGPHDSRYLFMQFRELIADFDMRAPAAG
jgi:carbamoyl-phosphate synthase small subunit